MAPCPSGKGPVCKTAIHQFDSDWRLTKNYSIFRVVFFYEACGFGIVHFLCKAGLRLYIFMAIYEEFSLLDSLFLSSIWSTILQLLFFLLCLQSKHKFRH